jgi:hypothetical protein
MAFNPSLMKSNAGYRGLMDLGFALMAASGPSRQPMSTLQRLGQAGPAFGQGYDASLNQGYQSLMSNAQLEKIEQDKQARSNVASFLGIGTQPGTPPQTIGMSPGGVGMPPAGPTVGAADRGNGASASPENVARARALYMAGDFKGAMEALYPKTEKPTTTGGLAYDPATKQWQPIPGYVEQQSKIRAAGKTTVNVDTGTKSPIGKLISDRKVLVETYGADHPSVQAIDREIAQQGIPSGDTARYTEMVASGKKVVESLNNELMPGGKVDMEKVRRMWTNLPFSEGRTTKSQFRDASAMLLRFETGAQANEQEIQEMLNRYMPSILDNEATVKDKLTRFQQRFESATKARQGMTDNDPKSTLKKKYNLE